MNAKNTVIALLSAAVLFTAPAMLSADPAKDNAAKAEKVEQAAPQEDAAMAEARAKREQFRSIMKEYRTSMQKLEDRLEQKQMELDYLSVNPNTKPDELKAIIAEIFDARAKMRDARRDVRAKLKEAGLSLPRPRSMRHQPRMHRGDFEGPRGEFFPPHHGGRMAPPPFDPHHGPMFGGRQPMPRPECGRGHHWQGHGEFEQPFPAAPMMDAPWGYDQPHHPPMFQAPCGRRGCPGQAGMAPAGEENYPPQEQPYEDAPEDQAQQ